jgi:integrase
MPRPRKSVPSYRLHKQSGQAVVTLRDGLGNRRDVLLGRHDTPESRLEYARVLAEWEAAGRRSSPATSQGGPSSLSVNELIVAYWQWAEKYYRLDEPRFARSGNLRDVLRVLKELYGHTPAAEFGPLALKVCRNKMVEKGWCRSYTNAQVGKLCRVFKWAAGEQLLPVTVYQALRTVEALRRGRTEARETRPVRPVAADVVEATLQNLAPVLRAMVEFQRLTGCRPDEMCRLRPIDIDMTNPSCWVYRPGSDQGGHGEHKTAHHGHDRLILIGPRAQAVLRPHLGTRVDAYCFSPVEAERQRNEGRRGQRQSPLTPSQRSRRPKAGRKRAPQDRYGVTSYRNAVYRAADRAHPLPPELAPRAVGKKAEGRKAWWQRLTAAEKEAVRAWRRAHRWHPNQLRHSRATELRSHGLDVVGTILGHSKLETSQVYAEKDLAAAMKLVERIG